VLAGDSGKGVFLCKHADVQLKAASIKGQQNCWLFMFLVRFLLTTDAIVFLQVICAVNFLVQLVAN